MASEYSKRDIRWKQRFSNFNKAFDQLASAVGLASERDLSPLEQQGLIKAFEFTFELAWNTVKDYLQYQGYQDIHGARDTFRLAFKADILTNGELWMDMIQSRNRTFHTYNEETAKEIVHAVRSDYFPEFRHILGKLQALESEEE